MIEALGKEGAIKAIRRDMQGILEIDLSDPENCDFTQEDKDFAVRYYKDVISEIRAHK